MNVIRKAEEFEYANIQRTGTPGHYTTMDWYRPCSSSFSYFSGIWVDSAVSWSRLSCITASRTDRDGGTTPGRRSSSRRWRGSGSSMTAMASVRTLWLVVPFENRIWFMMGSGGSLCWFILSLFWLYFLWQWQLGQLMCHLCESCFFLAHTLLVFSCPQTAVPPSYHDNSCSPSRTKTLSLALWSTQLIPKRKCSALPVGNTGAQRSAQPAELMT